MEMSKLYISEDGKLSGPGYASGKEIEITCVVEIDGFEFTLEFQGIIKE